MRLSQNTLLAAALATLVSAPSYALVANASHSASIHDISFTLDDLDLQDGIDPSLNFHDFTGQGTLAALIWEGQQVRHSGKGYVVPSASQASMSELGATTSSSATLASVQSAAATTFDVTPGQSHSAAFASATLQANFTLSPHTRITFNAGYSLSVAGNGIGDGGLRVHWFDPYNGGGSFQRSLFTSYDGKRYDSRSSSDTLRFELTNPTASAIKGSFYFSTSSSVQAVPEAAPLPTALAGLGAVGVMLLLRRKH